MLQPATTTISCLCLPLIATAFSLDQRRPFAITGAGQTAKAPRLLFDTKLSAASRPLSAADRERRDEESRRQERQKDVVIGKTSAKAGESDYALDIAATEQEWMRQASRVEQEIYRQTEQGMHFLKLLQVEEASSSFDRVFELKPNAYLWQAGIAKFYLNQLEDAAEILATSATRFESRFFEPASEERIWRNACELKLVSSIATKQERKRVVNEGLLKNVAQIESTENTAELLSSESRKVIRIARELFDATLEKDHAWVILSRAKLRSICGSYEEYPVLDKKMWKLNAWFYLGLYYDATGDIEESKKCMKMALRLCTSSTSAADIVHTLPMLHMARRDWFDDDDDIDDFAEDELNLAESSSSSKSAPDSAFKTKTKKKSPVKRLGFVDANPIVTDSIREGIDDLSVVELRQALSIRGLGVVGSKDILQGRLFDSLMSDAGLIA